MGFFKTVSSYIPRFVAFIILLAVAFGAVPAKDFVVTLDAGHGGHDYGAIGEKSNEKTITLAVVKQLGRLIESNLPDVKVVYTRDKDVFIPLILLINVTATAGRLRGVRSIHSAFTRLQKTSLWQNVKMQ